MNKHEATRSPLSTSAAIFYNCNLSGVSRSTKYSVLNDMAMMRKAETRSPLNKTHKLKRQEWAKKYLKTDLSKVLWTDEMRVTPDEPDGWARGWISNTHKAPLRLKMPARGRWCTGMGRLDLFGVWNELKINSQTYCQFLKDTSSSGTEKKSASFNKAFTFMQDNAPPHTTKYCMYCNYCTAWLASKGLKNEKLMTWPPSSPDLNPIENFWALLKQEI